MSASEDERREELRGRLPNVIRVAAGICANSGWQKSSNAVPAEVALAVVIECELVCGIGADDD